MFTCTVYKQTECFMYTVLACCMFTCTVYKETECFMYTV